MEEDNPEKRERQEPSAPETSEDETHITKDEIEKWVDVVLTDMAVKPVLGVPVDYSPAIEVLPANHEVIYSTLVMHNDNSMSGSGIGAIVAVAMNAAAKYKTHAIMTRFGIAGQIYHKKMLYVPWYAVSNVKGHKVFLTPVVYLGLQRVDQFETKQAFKQRKEAFPAFIIPHVVASWRAFLQSAKGMALDPRVRKGKIKQLNKMINECLKRATKLGLPLPQLEPWVVE